MNYVFNVLYSYAELNVLALPSICLWIFALFTEKTYQFRRKILAYARLNSIDLHRILESGCKYTLKRNYVNFFFKTFYWEFYSRNYPNNLEDVES